MKNPPKCYERLKQFVLLNRKSPITVEGTAKRLNLTQREVQICFGFMNREGLLSQATCPRPSWMRYEWCRDQYWLM